MEATDAAYVEGPGVTFPQEDQYSDDGLQQKMAFSRNGVMVFTKTLLAMTHGVELGARLPRRGLPRGKSTLHVRLLVSHFT